MVPHRSSIRWVFQITSAMTQVRMNTPTMIKLLAEDLEQFDAADEEGDKDRQPGDGKVVEDLPDRVREGPGVGLRHEGPVGRIQQRHASREDDREREDREEWEVLGGGTRRYGQQAHLGSGIEAEAKEE